MPVARIVDLHPEKVSDRPATAAHRFAIGRAWTGPLLLVVAVGLLLASSPAYAVNYSDVKARNADFIRSAQVPTAPGRASSGAIAIHPSGAVRRILPYDANLAVRGMLRAGTGYCPAAKAWLDWYVRHVNWPDRYGAFATIYDW